MAHVFRLNSAEREYFHNIISRDHATLEQYIAEGLPDTAGAMSRRLARLAFELRPDLRESDVARREVVRPVGSVVQ